MAIISHKYKFIFLHARKTAGSSVEVMLGQHCGPSDILYPTSDGKPYGVVEINNRKPLNNCQLVDFYSAIKRNKNKGSLFGIRKLWVQTRRIIPDKHATAYEIQNSIPKRVWNNYFKFCFERNSFDRLVSFYYWRKRNLFPSPPFKEFAFAAISNDVQHQKKYNAVGFSNRPFYMISDREVCDHVGKFENLDEEIKTICEHLSIPQNDELPRIKSTFRPKTHYSEYYCSRLIQAMEETFV